MSNLVKEDFNDEESLVEKEFTPEEVFSHYIGVDEVGDQKAVIDCSLIQFLGEDRKELTHFTSLNANINRLCVIGEFVLLEIDYKLMSNVWLKRMYGVVQRFHNSSAADDITFLLTITDLKCEFGYSLLLANPLMCVQGCNPNTGKPTIIQLLFSTDNMELLINEINLDSIKAEVLREIESEDGEHEFDDISDSRDDDYIEENMDIPWEDEFFGMRSSSPSFKEDNSFRSSDYKITKE